MSVISGLVSRVRDLIRRKPDANPEPSPSLNRRQRRDQLFRAPHSAEARMRQQRTHAMQAARRKSQRGDHGAKSRRAFRAGIEATLRWADLRIRQAYAQGRKDERSRSGLLSRFARKVRAFVSRASVPERTAAS